MRNKELIKWIKLLKLKIQILPNCFHRKYGAQLGEFTNTSFVVFEAERVKKLGSKICETQFYIYTVYIK